MDFKSLLYEKDGAIRIIKLNRPREMNALNDELIEELSMAMDLVSADDEARAAIITGGEKVFAAGGDIAFMSSADPITVEKFVDNVRQALEKIEKSSKPVVAAISGLALGGGCELALACDIRIAAEGTIFGQPEINLGIIPGAGGTQRLARTVGSGWAKQMVMLGQNIDADQALKIGLVTEVAAKDELMNRAKKIAQTLASKPPVALKAAKSCINYGMNVDLSSGLAFEIKSLCFLFATEDQKEGMKAFIEKRKPVFIGR